eukprot:GHVS01106201.1.p1 GENE.GHVS01106201.1~~GHVS01106201.1.p1  ORF type:complete len:936 (-),score=126.12 GHVS01106201.1:359-3166(-)
MASGIATVKQVISGDTLVLVGTPKGGPPPEKQLTLSSVMAPRVAMKSLTKQIEDEPYGWPSREFMRERVIGKTVEFKVEYTLGEREYGCIKLKDKNENVAKELLKKGLARVKSNRTPPCAHDIDELTAAEESAKEQKLGIWNDEPGAGQNTIREIAWAVNDPAAVRALFEENKQKKLKVIVEYVRDGGCMRVMFPDKWIYTTVFVSGVACDGFKREMREGSEEFAIIPEAFAAEAKFFVEIRLLNRECEFRLESLDDSGDIYGSFHHANGNVAMLLLKNGLAKLQEWSARLTESPAQLREAMKEAQSKQLRKWKGWEPTVLEGEKTYSAHVVEVVSGDCIMLQPLPTPQPERRVYLASLRCPRTGNRMKADEPWSFEAKECVRKKLISTTTQNNKTVKVVVEYMREPMVSASGAPPPMGSDSQGRMHFVSINLEGEKQGISEMLISNGLAKTQPHRADDDRAENFDVLLDVEKATEEKAIGIFGPETKAPKHRINELLGPSNAARARTFESQLTRYGRIDGVVEYIFNGGRFKLRIQKENLAISFVIGAIRCPQTARAAAPSGGPSRPGEPFAVEALQFAREQLMQRDVSVKIQQTDRGGNFIGTLWIGKSNFATQLLELGYACTVDFSLAMSPHKDEYTAAEIKAQNSKLNVWSIPGAIEKHKGVCANGGVGGGETMMEVVDGNFPVVIVSHINSITDFYIQQDGQKNGQNNNSLQIITKELNSYKDETENQFTAAGPPKKNDIVIAKFSADNQWYRGRVESRDGASGDFNILYIDFGNREIVSLSKLRRCSPSLTIAVHPAVAKSCALSGVLEPLDMEADGAQYLHDLTAGKTFKCQVEMVDAQRKHYILLTEQETAAATHGASSINELVLRKGLGRLDKKSKTKAFSRLQKEEEVARKQHLNVWRYGDVGDDDENEDDFLAKSQGAGGSKKR